MLAASGSERRGQPGDKEEEEEEGLYLQVETRERVQTNEAKSKRRRASPTSTTSRRDNTPASQCLPSRRALLASKGYRLPITPQGLRGEVRIPKRWPCPGLPTRTAVRERTRYLHWGGMKHAWAPPGTQRESKVPVDSPVSFPSALIKRGGSCPPLSLVELIQKVIQKVSTNLVAAVNTQRQ